MAGKLWRWLPGTGSLRWGTLKQIARGWGGVEENTMSAATQDDVISALKQCYDPEIPVNIVDLGLIYGVRFAPASEDQQDVTVDMTLTSQGCPAHVTIGEQVKSRLEQLPGIRNANVNVVWNPPWSPERLSPEARKQLGIE